MLMMTKETKHTPVLLETIRLISSYLNGNYVLVEPKHVFNTLASIIVGLTLSPDSCAHGPPGRWPEMRLTGNFSLFVIEYRHGTGCEPGLDTINNATVVNLKDQLPPSPEKS